MTAIAKQKIEELLAKADELDKAFADEQWEAVPALLQQRNDLAALAFTPDLPEELHEFAQQAFERLRAQDEELTEKAKLLQRDFRDELMQLNKSKKSIGAYKAK